MELLDPALDLFDGDAELASDLGLTARVVVLGEELVQRRIEQADRDRQAVHRLEDADEVLLLERLELGESGLAAGLVIGQDHLAHGDDALVAEKHVLGAAQADPLGTERPARAGVFGSVGVGADLEGPDLVGPGHERREVARDRRIDGRHLADHHVAGRAVDRDEVAGLDVCRRDRELTGLLVDMEWRRSRRRTAFPSPAPRRRRGWPCRRWP